MNTDSGDVDKSITTEEKALIVQLRQRVEAELPVSVTSLHEDDQNLFLVRWLRARDCHLDKATHMLKASLKWRQETNADDAVNFAINPFFTENFPHAFSGTDKFGHPVLLLPLNEWDFRKVLNLAERLAEFDSFVTNFFENTMNVIQQQHIKRKEIGQTPVTQCTMIIDVKNYSYMQLVNYNAFKKILQIAATYEAHYPEILYRCIFVNCPSYFGIFITLLKTVIAPRTLDKLKCYPNILEWQTDMIELVDPAKLPQKYGGTMIES